jgi:cardiolipin synthase
MPGRPAVVLASSSRGSEPPRRWRRLRGKLDGLPAAIARRIEWSARPVAVAGNRLRLLVNGEQYFPALLTAIEQARRSVHLETYIFADDRIGNRVAEALEAAAGRGVQVRLIVDGFGAGGHGRRLVQELGAHGVAVKVYRPERWWRLERKLLRRLHRKLAVIDEAIAFVGGINIIDDYTDVPLREGKAAPRFDFAVACEGPLVDAVSLAARRLWWTMELTDLRRLGRPADRLEPLPRARPGRSAPRFDDGMMAMLLLRDNLRNRRSIEQAYLDAIESARREIWLASAYFIPGRRLRAALRRAAARGVRVHLLLQGQMEYAVQHYGQQALYGQLLEAGIEIAEYVPSYLHAKAAVVDEAWATVGSSNIDPYSLLLAREANVAVFDERFAAALRTELAAAWARDARRIDPADYAQRGALTRLANWIAYGLLRFATVVLARGHNY